MSPNSQVYQMRPTAAILDFDGVIVDSLTAHIESWDDAVRSIFGKNLKDHSELLGHSTRSISHLIAQKFGDRSLAGALAHTKESFLLKRLQSIQLLDNSRYFLETAAKLHIPLGIASNSKTIYVERLLAHHNIQSHFQAIVCADQVRFPKPNPDMLWECANRLGINFKLRHNIAAFDDSPHGIEAIKSAGMTPFGIASLNNKTQLSDAGAIIVFNCLNEFLSCLSDYSST